MARQGVCWAFSAAVASGITANLAGSDIQAFVNDIIHHVDGGAASGHTRPRSRSRSPPAAVGRGAYSSSSAEAPQGGVHRPFGDPFAAAGHSASRPAPQPSPRGGGYEVGRGGYNADSRGRSGYGGPQEGSSAGHNGSSGGRYSQSGAPSHSGSGGNSRSLRVADLPPDLMDLSRLSGHFKRYGVVTNIMLQASKRMAYVQMDSREAAQRALDSRDFVCGNSAVSVSWARHDPSAPRDTPQGATPDAAGIAPPAHVHDSAPVVADAPVSALQRAAAPTLASVMAGESVGVTAAAPPVMDHNTARVVSLVQRKGEELSTIASMLASYKEAVHKLKEGGDSLSPGDRQALLVQVKAIGAEIKRKQAASAAALETAKRAAESAAESAAMDPAAKRAAAIAARGRGRGRGGRGAARGGGAARGTRTAHSDAAGSVEVADVVAAAAQSLAGTGMLKGEEKQDDTVQGDDGEYDEQEGGDVLDDNLEGAYDEEGDEGGDDTEEVVIGDE